MKKKRAAVEVALLSILHMPRERWRTLALDLPSDELMTLATHLQNSAVTLAEVGAYFEARAMRLKHEQSLKRTQRAYVKVRDALGYSHPKEGWVSF